MLTFSAWPSDGAAARGSLHVQQQRTASGLTAASSELLAGRARAVPAETGAGAAAAFCVFAATAGGFHAGLSQRRKLRQRLHAAAADAESEQSVRTGEKQLQFTPGDKLASARNFAATRFFAVAPWDKNVDPKPVFIVSDNTGDTAKCLAKAAFLQLGKSPSFNSKMFVKIDSKEAIQEVLSRAENFKKAMVVATMASPELTEFLMSQGAEQGIPCINALEPVLRAMERRFDMRRACLDDGKKKKKRVVDEDAISDSLVDLSSSKDLTIFAVSDSSGRLASSMARAALKQFKDAGVKTITVCPRVNSLEEVDHIAASAFASNSLVLFSFASPGLSRFMRQQCERIKVMYADVFQPTVMEMEKYFNYPPVGVAGGMDMPALDTSRLRWEKQPV